MTENELAFGKALAETARKCEGYNGIEIPIPAWLQSQVNAIYLMGEDFHRGLAAYAKSLRDEKDILDALRNWELSPKQEGV